MNRFVICVCSVFLGVFIGLCLPYSLFSSCPIPLLGICDHVFWDWGLRVLQVAGTLLAVIVALYKEPLQRFLVRPNLCMDLVGMQEQLVHEGDNDVANAYNGRLKISNGGSNKANNIVVTIENIVYRRYNGTQAPQVLIEQPIQILSSSGKEISSLPTDDEVLFTWFSVLKAQSQEIGGQTQAIPMKFLIGSKEIPGSCFEGLIDVTFKLKCDELKPQLRTLRIEWNGSWKSRQVDMIKVFTYKWNE